MRKTGQAERLRIEGDIAAYGLERVTDSTGRVRWRACCTKCGKEEDCFRADLRDADQMINHFLKRGWVMRRKEPMYCSTSCQREAREQLEKQRAMQRAMQQEIEMKHPTTSATSTMALTTVAGTAIGPDPKMLRRVFAMLDDNFDTDRRLYRSGWSDERIAKEASASLEFVTKYRREAYGELAEHPEIGRLRDDIKAMDELYTKQLKQLEGSFASQINELRSRLEKLGLLHNKAAG